ncbi:MAG: hypothetical protein Q9221_001452 [Calogaya cf. arnoldii]
MLHHLTPSDPHAKRSLVSLVAQGIAFFFAHLDIVVATAIEANYMSDTYRNSSQTRARNNVTDDNGICTFLATRMDINFVTDDQIVEAVVLFAEIMANRTRHMGVVLFDAWLLVHHVWVLVRVFIPAQNLVT